MGIKLENYSLISNDVLDRLIKESNLGKTITTVDSQMATSLKRVKEQLIPSRLLAEKCFDAGRETDDYGYGNANDKHTFLTSEIEL